jgi:MFS family permease
VVERLVKSIRGAPRDALLADVAHGETRGALFGLHKAFDKAGAIAGPVAAYALLARFGQSLAGFRKLFAIATVPALAAVVVLAVFVRERAGAPQRHGSIRERLRSFGPRYRHYLVSACLFSLAYFSTAFLMLALSRVGFGMKEVALLYGLFNLSFTVVSVPIGWLGDRIGRRVLIALSYVLFVAVAAGFARVDTKGGAVALLVLYGVFYAIDEGQTKAYLADLVPEDARATAIGTYGFVTALAYLPASLVFGFLWQVRGPETAFLTAAGVALLSLAYFLAFRPRATEP